ncbi:hypothetical protein POX_b02116 [Penicillium oxalicum]|nr:hypothetical protein POX_b02116 [Penicillium oxalicum]KAI2792082.1 hypothetical protein POX_b02116 [Penicillium oxalicum]
MSIIPIFYFKTVFSDDRRGEPRMGIPTQTI